MESKLILTAVVLLTMGAAGGATANQVPVGAVSLAVSTPGAMEFEAAAKTPIKRLILTQTLKCYSKTGKLITIPVNSDVKRLCPKGIANPPPPELTSWRYE